MTIKQFGENLCQTDNNDVEIEYFSIVLGGVEFCVNEIGIVGTKYDGTIHPRYCCRISIVDEE